MSVPTYLYRLHAANYVIQKANPMVVVTGSAADTEEVSQLPPPMSPSPTVSVRPISDFQSLILIAISGGQAISCHIGKGSRFC